MSDKARKWTFEHPDGGRIDVNGVEWFACDPYPTFYRRENGELIINRTTRFADQPKLKPPSKRNEKDYYYGSDDNHRYWCDRVIRARWSGVSCDCHARWFCL